MPYIVSGVSSRDESIYLWIDEKESIFEIITIIGWIYFREIFLEFEEGYDNCRWKRKTETMIINVVGGKN